jgi:hypothetical protein
VIEKTTTYSRSANQNPGTAQPDKAPFSDGSRFAPGPWVARPDPRENGEWEVVKPDDDKDFADEPWFIAGCFDDADGASAEANARLIAAAPDLHATARAYEAWEADVILNADWSGETPRLNQHQWDWLINIQGMRNAALAKALSPRSARHG